MHNSHTHCQAAQAQAQTKACQRVCLPQPRENFKIFLHAKRKRIDKYNMKKQFDRHIRTDKNRQCITGGIFYCRVSAGFSVSASNKLSCNLTGQCFDSPRRTATKTYRQSVSGNAKIPQQAINY